MQRAKRTIRRTAARRVAQAKEAGYILLTLMLFTALLVIAAAVTAPTIAFEIKREREQELVHRGVQYSRAIRAFTKATGGFPQRLDQLQSTEGRRFIRKLYKDPITGKDFRLLHLTDVHSATSAANPIPAAPQASADSTDGSDPPNPPDANGRVDGQSTTVSRTPQSTAVTATNNLPTGGVILGVASESKAHTIREFNHKSHYKDWLFFYDPAFDRGLPINGPTSLTLPPAQPLNAPAPPQGQPQTPAPDQSQNQQ